MVLTSEIFVLTVISSSLQADPDLPSLDIKNLCYMYVVRIREGYTYKCTHIRLYVNTHVFVCKRLYVNALVRLYVKTHVFVCKYTNTIVCKYTYVCM